MTFEPNPDFEAQLSASLAPKLERATGEMAKALHENLGPEPPRTGRKYARLPNRSSAPGEFPARQSGEMQDGVYHAGTDDPLAREVGIQDSNLAKLRALEFGNPAGGLTERAPVARTVESEDVQAAALESMKGE